MDVAADKGLFDFLDSLDGNEREAGTLPQVSTAVNEETETDVWSDIADALNNWTQHVLDAESRHTTSQINTEKAIRWIFRLSGYN